MLGPDVGSGSNALVLNQFRITAQATYPLLIACGDGGPDTNLLHPYFERHNFVVINSTGIIRYHANDFYPYGQRYHRDELRAVIDSLIPGTMLDVGDPAPAALALTAAPNPFPRETALELSAPAAAHARVTILDLAGRRVATLWDGPAPPGVTRLRWDGRDESGESASPGIYLAHAEVGGVRVTRRLVRLL